MDENLELIKKEFDYWIKELISRCRRNEELNNHNFELIKEIVDEIEIQKQDIELLKLVTKKQFDILKIMEARIINGSREIEPRKF